MSATDVANVKNAAIELLKVYDPAQHDVAVLALPYPQTRRQVQGREPAGLSGSAAGDMAGRAPLDRLQERRRGA